MVSRLLNPLIVISIILIGTMLIIILFYLKLGYQYTINHKEKKEQPVFPKKKRSPPSAMYNISLLENLFESEAQTNQVNKKNYLITIMMITYYRKIIIRQLLYAYVLLLLQNHFPKHICHALTIIHHNKAYIFKKSIGALIYKKIRMIR